MTEDRDQLARIYAANLLNRAGGDATFDYRDVAVLARLLPLIEADLADWLESQLRGVVSRGQIVAAVRGGQARPDLPQPHPASASLEPNLR